MKRSIVGTIALGTLVCTLVTGCGSEKKLECTQKADDVGITFNFNFSGDKVKTMDFAYDIDLSEFTDEQIGMFKEQDFCSLAKGAMTDYTDAFRNCKQDISGKTLKVTADFDLNKITDSKVVEGGIDQAKKELEEEGFTCTIK